jgi:hypothetical protein
VVKGGGGVAVASIESPEKTARERGALSTSAFPPLVLPCSLCGEAAAYVTAPELSTMERGVAAALLKLLSLKMGRALELPSSGNVLELVAPEQITQLLRVTCWECGEAHGA